MIDNDFEIHASPYFRNVRCPKHGTEMIELPNGWLGTCWYCVACKYPYHLRLMKMRVVNKENLKKALEKALGDKKLSTE